LSDIEQLGDGDVVHADAPELGAEWLIPAAPPEAVDRRVRADAAGGRPHILPAFHPLASRFAGALDAAV
jgi:hypothetical protein